MVRLTASFALAALLFSSHALAGDGGTGDAGADGDDAADAGNAVAGDGGAGSGDLDEHAAPPLLPAQPPRPPGSEASPAAKSSAPAESPTPELPEPVERRDPKQPRVIWTSRPSESTGPFLPEPGVPADRSTQPEPPRPTRSYAGQTLAADGLSIAALFVAPPLGAAGYALGAPIVHWSHGHTGKGFASVGLRLSLPLVGALAGTGGKDCGEFCGGAIIGALVGVAAAITIDSAFLAREEVPVESAEIRVAPSVGASRRGMTLGLAGSF